MRLQDFPQASDTVFVFDFLQVVCWRLYSNPDVGLLVDECPVQYSISRRGGHLLFLDVQATLGKNVVVGDFLLEQHAGRNSFSGVEVSRVIAKDERYAPAIHGSLTGRRVAESLRIEREASYRGRFVASVNPLGQFIEILHGLGVRCAFVGLPEH